MKATFFINGKWVDGTNYEDLRSPYNGDIIKKIPIATEEQTNEAIQAAYDAKSSLANMPAHKRATILENLVILLEEQKEKAAKLIALEAAKPITAARVEVQRTIQTYQFSAEEAKRIQGETLPLDAAPGGENRVAYTVREPKGVVGAITPFNFPMNLVAHKLGPAIASGNTIVLKPASQTPLSALFIAELLQEAGLPDGCLNVVTGGGRSVGNQLVADDRINMLTFTGSPRVGKEIRNKAGLKQVTLELGSNSAVIVDAGVNLDKVVPRCVGGAFTYQGQMCIALQRIYVHDSIYDDFVDKFVKETKKLVTGNPLDEETNVSALITEGDITRTIKWINEAKEAGSAVAVGGKNEGNVLTPTVLLNVDPNQSVSCKEVFAPIVSINKFSDVDDAISLVNDSIYGLQAGIFTNNLQTSLRAARQLHVGGVIINDIPTFRVDHMPYGGVKDSGMGREGIKYAIEEMTEMKLVVFNEDM